MRGRLETKRMVDMRRNPQRMSLVHLGPIPAGLLGLRRDELPRPDKCAPCHRALEDVDLLANVRRGHRVPVRLYRHEAIEGDAPAPLVGRTGASQGYRRRGSGTGGRRQHGAGALCCPRVPTITPRLRVTSRWLRPRISFWRKRSRVCRMDRRSVAIRPSPGADASSDYPASRSVGRVPLYGGSAALITLPDLGDLDHPLGSS